MNAHLLPQTTAFFLARGDSSLFCLLLSPPAGVAPVGAMLHVPAFAEEMNKARRAVSLSARAMAARGWHILLLDPTGTGDSSGEFADATWNTWLADIRHAVHWLQSRTGLSPGLWGFRSGCLLISDALADLPCSNVLLWQPQISGESALAQFLRLRTMSGLSDGTQPRETTRMLAAELDAGKAIEVAGYTLAPELALPLRRVRLGGDHFRNRHVIWLDVSQAEPPALAPASEVCVEQLRTNGAIVKARAIAGLSFWMTQEIDECPSLTRATVECLVAAA